MPAPPSNEHSINSGKGKQPVSLEKHPLSVRGCQQAQSCKELLDEHGCSDPRQQRSCKIWTKQALSQGSSIVFLGSHLGQTSFLWVPRQLPPPGLSHLSIIISSSVLSWTASPLGSHLGVTASLFGLPPGHHSILLQQNHPLGSPVSQHASLSAHLGLLHPHWFVPLLLSLPMCSLCPREGQHNFYKSLAHAPGSS